MARSLQLRFSKQARHPVNKYGAEAVLVPNSDGSVTRIHSKREARRWAELQLLQRAGTISQLERQITYTFSEADFMLSRGWQPPHTLERGGEYLTHLGSNRKVRYVLDFRYVDEHGQLVHEDAKGVRTDAYKRNQALMYWVHGIEVLEV